jgi:hypothetical protein
LVSPQPSWTQRPTWISSTISRTKACFRRDVSCLIAH